MVNSFHEIETPFFILDKSKLDQNINQLKNALNTYWPNYIIGYSFKTNALPWLLKYLQRCDFYGEVASSDEYCLAVATGYPCDQIIYNGPVKNEETFIEALMNGAIVNIDSKLELDWLNSLLEKTYQQFKVGLRVNFSIEDFCPDDIGYEKDGTRFGFSLETGELYRVIDRLLATGRIQIAGLHLHSTSQTRSINVYRQLAKIACKINDDTGLVFDYIDIGGGFFGGVPNKPTFSEYLSAISQELKKNFDVTKTKLILEPGSAIIGSPISFLTSVIDVKDTKKSRIVTIDGSRVNIDPLMRKSAYSFNVSTHQTVRKINPKQIICGFSCMDLDRLMILNNSHVLDVNDRIMFNMVGSYTMSLNPLFVNFFPPVYIKDGDCLELARRKMSINDYLQIGNSVG
ncbi:MAG: pyridoxal-dependent decarboxylase [Acetobacterium woodii]|nr:pyridoxal-dependent decarboxylase [Acetobacterium woodii]